MTGLMKPKLVYNLLIFLKEFFLKNSKKSEHDKKKITYRCISNTRLVSWCPRWTSGSFGLGHRSSLWHRFLSLPFQCFPTGTSWSNSCIVGLKLKWYWHSVLPRLHFCAIWHFQFLNVPLVLAPIGHCPKKFVRVLVFHFVPYFYYLVPQYFENMGHIIKNILAEHSWSKL